MTAPLSFTPGSIQEAMQLAEMFAKSNLVPVALRKQPSDVLIVLLTGLELGVSPMASLRLIAVIDGKPAIESDLYLACVLAHPDCEKFDCVETTATQATYVSKRKGRPEQKLTWTIKQAATAGLLSKANWKNYPEAMLRHRCVSALARMQYADRFAGVYSGDEEDDLRNAKDVTPAADALPAKGVAAVAERLAEINAVPDVVGPAVVTEPAIETVGDPAPLPPKASPPKGAAKAAGVDRKPGTIKGKPIKKLSAEELAEAIQKTGAMQENPKATPEQKAVAVEVLKELLDEQERRIAAPAEGEESPAGDPPEPGSEG